MPWYIYPSISFNEMNRLTTLSRVAMGHTVPFEGPWVSK